MRRVSYFQFGNDNPFQRRFYSSAAQHGVDVRPLSYRALWPLSQTRMGDILHLDWLHPFYKSSSRLKSRLKRAILTSDLRGLKASRVVWTVHNLLSHDSHLPERFERECIRTILCKIDAVMAFSAPTLELLIREFPAASTKRRFVIPHGNYCDDYDPPWPQESARDALGLPWDGRMILFFGGLRSNKGVAELIAAFEMIDVGDARLVIAGGGETPELTPILDRAATNPRIHLHRRFVEASEVPKFFGAADVVALPFRRILNSGSAILAISMAKCVIVPDCPSLVASIPDFARFTYPQHAPHRLVESMREALGANDLLERGERARDYAKADLDWAKIGGLARDMYQELSH